MTVTTQAAFTGGEIAESAWGRVDLTKYQAAVARGDNFFVHVHGGMSNRAGTEYVGPVPDHAFRSRAIDFRFNDEQAYTLVFGDQVMRVVRNGGLVLEDPFAIGSITLGNPAIVTINAHGFADGKELYILDAGGMVEVQSRFLTVRNPTANTFELEDEWGNPVDSSAYTPSSGGQLGAVYELATPWQAGDLHRLKYEQQADVVTFTHRGYAPQNITRTDHNAWTLEPFLTGTTTPAPTNLATGNPGGASEFVVTAVIDEDESLPSAPVATVAHATNSIGLTWDPVPGAELYNVYGRETNGGVYGYAGTSETAGYVYDQQQPAPDYADNPPSERTLFDQAGEYPGTTTYYDGRQLFGETVNEPQVLHGSSVTGYTNFNRAPTVKDGDAFKFVLNARQINPIRHLVPLDKLVVLTAGAEWIANGSDGNGFLAPTQPPNLRTRSGNGSSHVRPLLIDDTVLYVQEQGSLVRDLVYTLEKDNYAGTDLTVLAPHLVEGYEIQEAAWAAVPERLALYVRDDGRVLAFAYMREQDIWAWTSWWTVLGRFESVCAIPEGEEYHAYFIVERTINGQTRRYIERQHSRRLLDRVTKVVDDRHAFHVDCGLTYDVPQAVTGLTSANPAVLEVVAHGWSDDDWIDLELVKGDAHPREEDAFAEVVNGLRYAVKVLDDDHVELYDYQEPYEAIDLSLVPGAYASGGIARKAVNQVSGLHHLEGEAVAVLGDGNVVANGWDDEIPIVVTNGTITLPTRHGILVVGLPICAELETLPLPINQGGRKQVTRLTMTLQESRGVFAGPDLDNLSELAQRYLEAWGDPVSLFTGDIAIDLNAEWELTAQLAIRQRDPLPLTILALKPDVESGH